MTEFSFIFYSWHEWTALLSSELCSSGISELWFLKSSRESGLIRTSLLGILYVSLFCPKCTVSPGILVHVLKNEIQLFWGSFGEVIVFIFRYMDWKIKWSCTQVENEYEKRGWWATFLEINQNKYENMAIMTNFSFLHRWGWIVDMSVNVAYCSECVRRSLKVWSMCIWAGCDWYFSQLFV